MKIELQKALLSDFPELYQEYYLPMTKTCMCWGFEVPDAWEPVIRRLSGELKALIEKTPQGYELYRAVQVKEKWGGLRFYMSSETDEMSEAIETAEKELWEIEKGRDSSWGAMEC
jgi:hypothetical protein